jgi:hypothetical protein
LQTAGQTPPLPVVVIMIEHIEMRTIDSAALGMIQSVSNQDREAPPSPFSNGDVIQFTSRGLEYKTYHLSLSQPQRKSGIPYRLLFLHAKSKVYICPAEFHHTPTSSFSTSGYFNLTAIKDRDQAQAASPHGASNIRNIHREARKDSSVNRQCLGLLKSSICSKAKVVGNLVYRDTTTIRVEQDKVSSPRNNNQRCPYLEELTGFLQLIENQGCRRSIALLHPDLLAKNQRSSGGLSYVGRQQGQCIRFLHLIEN